MFFVGALTSFSRIPLPDFSFQNTLLLLLMHRPFTISILTLGGPYRGLDVIAILGVELILCFLLVILFPWQNSWNRCSISECFFNVSCILLAPFFRVLVFVVMLLLFVAVVVIIFWLSCSYSPWKIFYQLWSIWLHFVWSCLLFFWGGWSRQFWWNVHCPKSIQKKGLLNGTRKRKKWWKKQFLTGPAAELIFFDVH